MPRRIALLIGNGKIRDASGKGYRITIPGIEHDLAAMAEVLGDVPAGERCQGHAEVGGRGGFLSRLRRSST
mgnify:CR=1 FL=1